MNYNYFEFDYDKNGVIALTEDNVARINFIINNDSKYRQFHNKNNPTSIDSLILNSETPWDLDKIIDIVTAIDKQNSTHQDSTGIKKNDSNHLLKNNGGRKKTAEFIYYNIDDFYNRLKKGDESLVNEIAKALYNDDGTGRYTFSFASKFCTYVSQILYNSDEYCIYDNVLACVLPYYEWAYLGQDNYFGRTKSKISKCLGVDDKKGDYYSYKKLIDRIRCSNEKLTGYLISRNDFDKLLWYYFKGDYDIKNKEKIIIYTSRTSKALMNLRKENTVLTKKIK